MSAPLFLMVAPLIMALIAFSLRRWPQFAGPVAALMAWLVAIILHGYDLSSRASGAAWQALGQSLTLTEQGQSVLVAVYVLAGIIVLLTAFYAQSRIFVALSLAVLAPFSAALMVQPSAHGAVWLLIAAGALAMLIQGGRAGSTLAALRVLALATLALPLLLGAGWMIESDQFRFLDTITLLLTVALLLLSTSFPFQIWVAPVVSESSSLTTSVVFGVGQLVMVGFCLQLLVGQPFAFGSAQFQGVVSLSAAATLILATVLTITARSFGHQLGYLLLLSIGTVTAVIGSGDAMAVELTVTLLILRAIALIIAGAGLALIRARAVTVAGGVNQFAANQGLGWRTPLGIGLFAFGCLSLTGMPFTPGFAGTWPAVAVIAKHAGWLATLLVLSVAGGAFGVLRRLIPMLVRPDVSGDDSAGPGESRSVQLVSTAILLGGAFVTIFPQLILNFAGKLADLF